LIGEPLSRSLIANLDCEVDWARAWAPPGRQRSAGAAAANEPRFALPPAVLRSISAAGTLLRAFASEGDRLWTPLPVEPARLADAPGVPRIALETGPLPAGAPILAWGETPAVETLRRRALSARGEEPGKQVEGGTAAAVWKLGHPPASCAAAANHRGFALRAARLTECALPGAALIGSPAELERHLADCVREIPSFDGWVLKAPFSAAGRSRLFGHGGDPLSGASRRHAERLFSLYGSLLFEPWMERLADFGLSALLDRGRLEILGAHRLEVDARGRFHGITLAAGAGETSGLLPAEYERFVEVAGGVARLLAEAGYEGPFGIDCWRYRGPGGEPRFQPLGEINARMTFGLVARVLAERVEKAMGLAPGATCRLRLSRRGEIPRLESAGRLVELLRPGEEDPTAAWLEIEEGS
jgi:hypothetical protein